MPVCRFAVFAHGQASCTQDISYREFLWIFCVALIERNDCLPVVDFLNDFVDAFGIVGFISKKSTLGKREKCVGTFQNFRSHGAVGDIRRGGHLEQGQPRNAVHQNVIFVAPVELGALLILLIGGRMNAKTAVRVIDGMVILAEFVLCKGLRVIEFRVCRHRRGVQTDKGTVHNTFLIEFYDLA